MTRTLIIAEAGVNHNGSLELAYRLIDVAKNSGADVVKFQTWTASGMVSKYARKADYQVLNTQSQGSQLEMLQALEMTVVDQLKLVEYCRKIGIEFLSSPFDIPSVTAIASTFKLKRIKIPSGEITNAPLLLEIARTGLPSILSTGMSTLAEIESALGVLAFGYINSPDAPSISAFSDAFASADGRLALARNVTLLHCVTEYPAPFSEINLRAMKTMHSVFKLPIGYSDHTLGISVPLAAVALGAKVIEKHFTLDKNFPGPDHSASIEPSELCQMVKSIREVEASLGGTEKRPGPTERKNIAIARKSLVAARAIRRGERFSLENLTMKRPGNGISPFAYWEYLEKFAEIDFQEDELIL